MSAKNTCPVLPLAREAQRLADAISEADEDGDRTRASALNERLEAVQLAASHLQPTSAAGAQYQIRLMVALADRIHTELPEQNRFRALQAIDRLAGTLDAAVVKRRAQEA